jgi:hypothetical protein
MHCKQDPIYVFPEMKQRGLIPNFYILRAIVGIYKSEKMQNLQIAATYRTYCKLEKVHLLVLISTIIILNKPYSNIHVPLLGGSILV